jgi:hypothetical protein
MRILTCLVFLFLATNIYPQTQNNLRVTIRSQQTVLVRNGPRIQDFPEKKRATVIQPIFSGLSPSVLKQIRTTLALKNIFGSTLNDYRQDSWLEEFGYEVHFNQQGILSIAYTQSGSGAYPDQQTKHFVVDLKTGRTIKPSEVFVASETETLAALVDTKLQAEVRQVLSETGEEGRSAYEGKNLRFEVKDLENFTVGPKGITFIYDAGFPHVIQALEPDGQYLLSFAELKPYLRSDGQLGQFIP